MSDHTNNHTDSRVVHERIETDRRGGGTGLAFIVGGLVVAVLVLVWLFTGGDFGLEGGGGQTNINVDAPAVEAPAVEAPAPAADAPAPAAEGN